MIFSQQVIIFTLVSSVSDYSNRNMMKDDVRFVIRVIKCTYLNFVVSLTFPVARDPRVVLNECPSKKSWTYL